VLPEAVAFTSILPDVHLELEELDLDSLQDLESEPLSVVEPVPEAAPEPALEPAPVGTFSEDDHLVTLSGLEELDTLPRDFLMTPPEPDPEPDQDLEAELGDSLSHLPAAAFLLDGTGATEVAERASDEPMPEFHEPLETLELDPLPEAVIPLVVPAAGGQIPAVPGQVIPVSSEPASVSSEPARAMLQALLADPVLVDALVKAVVARMGDQVLREIAWEVMPDLAGRLQR
jgi:hypothetical protein